MRVNWHAVWRSFWPELAAVSRTEQWRAALGAMLAIALTGWLSHSLAPQTSATWLVAPMGASAVLLLALPSSPLTQPWSVVGGNTLSALVGLAVYQFLPHSHMAAGLAVGLALLTMFCLRCLHPPGGAVALLMVLTQTHDWRFALEPVMLNSVVLVLLATLYNRMTGRAYPHPKASPSEVKVALPRFTTDDLDAALQHYNQVIDMDRQDLQALLHDAQAHAYQRTLGQLRCSDIMSTRLVTVRGHEHLAQAWQLLVAHNIKSLPVVDELGHVMGIITRSDFIAHWHGAPDARSAPKENIQVRQRMTRQVRVVNDGTHLIDLLPLFSQEGHHHLPMVNGDQVLVGMITESDVIRALCRALG